MNFTLTFDVLANDDLYWQPKWGQAIRGYRLNHCLILKDQSAFFKGKINNWETMPTRLIEKKSFKKMVFHATIGEPKRTHIKNVPEKWDF